MKDSPFNALTEVKFSTQSCCRSIRYASLTLENVCRLYKPEYRSRIWICSSTSMGALKAAATKGERAN
ncbi:hypothetical protein D3C71_1800680 [compost metagenome]